MIMLSQSSLSIPIAITDAKTYIFQFHNIHQYNLSHLNTNHTTFQNLILQPKSCKFEDLTPFQ